MSYIKFNNDDTQYEARVRTFKNQHGIRAVSIISDPIEPNDSGFKYFNDDGELINDFSAFTYHFEENTYTNEEDTPEYGHGTTSSLPASELSAVYGAIAKLNTQTRENTNNIAEITPYTESKEVYIDDTEVFFDYKEGNISAWLMIENNQIPCEYEVIDGQIRVFFEPLEEVGTVHISIQ